MREICCVGHITLDEIITPQTRAHLPGGTSWYFSNAISKLHVDYQLITAVAKAERDFVKQLEAQQVDVQCFDSRHTINFINSYAENQDHRTQKVKQQADSFTAEQLQNIDAAIVHLGPLVANDIPPQLIPMLAQKAKVSLDVQGYLRNVAGEDVVPVRWETAKDFLPYVHFLKANEYELEVLTGTNNIFQGAKMLANMGVKEVIITLGSIGSVILCNGAFHTIPAFPPTAVVDATGCGDTYMAGYLYKRVKGAEIEEAGRFGAAMATVVISHLGPYTGTEADVLKVIVDAAAVSV